MVEEGIWRERLVITQAIVLLGRGPGRTRLLAPDGSPSSVEIRSADQVQIHGMSIEGGDVGVDVAGGGEHRFEDVVLSGLSTAGLVARNARLIFSGGQVSDVAGGKTGRGFDLEGGSIELRNVVMRGAGRRAVVLHKGNGLFTDLDVRGSSLSALQATDGADARVVRGIFAGMGGAALYAGAARLSVEGARVSKGEYAVIGFRGADVTVTGGLLTDYRNAGIALVVSRGTVQQVEIARGGTEAAISITGTDKSGGIALLDNRIRDPGTMGVHITKSAVTARGNTITGARLDRENDMGDGFYAVDSELALEQNFLRGNAGSGVSGVRSRLRMTGNTMLENGRAGLLLGDRSRGTVSGNLFQRNRGAGVEVAERSHATLARNRFGENPGFHIDTGCGAGMAEVESGNTFAVPRRERPCPE
jgi:parallel beta-helix repeat protein